LHEAGRLGEAERLYLSMLGDRPDDFDALLQLSALRLQQGRAEQSFTLANRAATLAPQSAEARSNRATALHAMKRHEEAVASYEDALTLDPEFVEAHYGLGTALMATGHHDEAGACFERSVALDPDYVEAWCGLGASQLATGRIDRSLLSYNKAIALAPDLSDAHFGLAAALKNLGRDDRAAVSYARALALKPDFAEAHVGLGICQVALDRYDEALVHFNAALALNPDNDEAVVNLGKALEELGRSDEARDAFERAFALRPRKPANCYALAMSRKLDANSPCLTVMEQLVGDLPKLRDEDQVLLHFALGKAYTDLGLSADGFAHVLAGNAIKRRRITYDERGALAAINRIGTTFTPALMQSHVGEGEPSRLPIFIVGMPRSGSTLVEQILASHPQVYAGGERSDFAAAMKAVGLDGSAETFPYAVRDIGAGELRKIASGYLVRLVNAMSSRDTFLRMTDKMPANFLFVGLIHLVLPNARIIHTCRAAVDTCLSCFSTMFEQPYACDLGELGRYYRTYSGLMDHWRSVLPAGVMIDVQYEDVVDDVERQARRIIAHCGLPWSDACLAFHTTARPVKTASVLQVRRPIYQSSVGRWRPDDDTLRPLLAELGPLP